MTYTFELDRKANTWTAYDPDDNQIDSGDLPLTDAKRAVATMEDKGVGKPTQSALQAVFASDWETTEA